MEDNIFTGNIFIEILVRFKGNLSSFDDALLSGFIEKSNRDRIKYEVEASSIYFVNVQS